MHAEEGQREKVSGRGQRRLRRSRAPPLERGTPEGRRSMLARPGGPPPKVGCGGQGLIGVGCHPSHSVSHVVEMQQL